MDMKKKKKKTCLCLSLLYKESESGISTQTKENSNLPHHHQTLERREAQAASCISHKKKFVSADLKQNGKLGIRNE
jgi:hypothetical protein